MGIGGSKPSKEDIIKVYGNCNGNILDFVKYVVDDKESDLISIDSFVILYDFLLEIHEFLKIKELYKLVTELIDKNFNNVTIGSLVKLYTKFYTSPVLSPSELTQSFDLLFKIKEKDESMFKELMKLVAYHFHHSLIQLSMKMDNPVTLNGRFKYEVIESLNPNGIYINTNDNKQYSVTNEIKPIERYHSVIDGGMSIFYKNLYYFECENNNSSLRYVLVNDDYLFITEKKNDYKLAERVNKSYNRLRYNENEIMSRDMLTLSCMKMQRDKIPLNNDIYITFLLVLEECEEEIEDDNGLLILKIGNNELYYKNHEVEVKNNNVGREIELVNVDKPLYRINILTDLYESIEISGECNVGKNCKCCVGELRIFEKDTMINDYIFSLPIIGKDLIDENDMKLKIINDVKMMNSEIHRNMLLKESESIYNYEDRYYINKREIEMSSDKKCSVKMKIIIEKEWKELKIVIGKNHIDKRLNVISKESQKKECVIIFNQQKNHFQIWKNNKMLCQVSAILNEILNLEINPESIRINCMKDNESKFDKFQYNLEIEKAKNIILFTERKNVLKDYELEIEGINDCKMEENIFIYNTESGPHSIILTNKSETVNHQVINIIDENNNVSSFRDKNGKEYRIYKGIDIEDVSLNVEVGMIIEKIDKFGNRHKYERVNFNVNQRSENLYFKSNWTVEQLVLFSYISMKDILPIPNDEYSKRYKEFYNSLEYDNIYLSNKYNSNVNPYDIFHKILVDNDISHQPFVYKLTNDSKCLKCNKVNTTKVEMDHITLSHTYYKPIYAFRKIDKNDHKNEDEEIVFCEMNGNEIQSYYVINRKKGYKPITGLYIIRNDDGNCECFEIDGTKVGIIRNGKSVVTNILIVPNLECYKIPPNYKPLHLKNYKILVQKVAIDCNGNKYAFDDKNSIITTTDKYKDYSPTLIDVKFDKKKEELEGLEKYFSRYSDILDIDISKTYKVGEYIVKCYKCKVMKLECVIDVYGEKILNYFNVKDKQIKTISYYIKIEDDEYTGSQYVVMIHIDNKWMYGCLIEEAIYFDNDVSKLCLKISETKKNESVIPTIPTILAVNKPYILDGDCQMIFEFESDEYESYLLKFTEKGKVESDAIALYMKEDENNLSIVGSLKFKTIDMKFNEDKLKGTFMDEKEVEFDQNILTPLYNNYTKNEDNFIFNSIEKYVECNSFSVEEIAKASLHVRFENKRCECHSYIMKTTEVEEPTITVVDLSNSEIDMKYAPFTYETSKLVSIILHKEYDNTNIGLFFGYTNNEFIIFRDKEILSEKNENLTYYLSSLRTKEYYPVFVIYRKEAKQYDDGDNEIGFKEEGFEELYRDLCKYYTVDNILINDYKNENYK